MRLPFAWVGALLMVDRTDGPTRKEEEARKRLEDEWSPELSYPYEAEDVIFLGEDDAAPPACDFVPTRHDPDREDDVDPRHHQILADIEIVLNLVRDEADRRGYVCELDITEREPGEIRVRIVAGDLSEEYATWSYSPRHQGRGTHVQRVEDVHLEDYVDLGETLYSVMLTNLKRRFERSLLL